MPAGRVLATQQARDAAKQLLALTGSVKDKVGRVLQQGSLLADPAHWGGGLAGKWRNDWGPDTNQLNQATAKLDELEHRAQLVIDDIFKADSAPGSAGVALATFKSPPPQAKEKDHGLLGDIGGFFKSAADIKMRFDLGVWDGAVGFVTGLGGLIGRDPTTGRWSWSAAGTAWGGLGKFALALNPEALIVDQTVGVPGLERGELGNTLLNAGKGLIAYDEWGKDPARAAGTATFNIAAAVLGTKGAGAGLRAAGAAADATRVAGAAADAGGAAGTAEGIGVRAAVDAGEQTAQVDRLGAAADHNIDLSGMTETPVWRETLEPLSRADNRPPSEIFRDGFHPKNPANVDLRTFVKTEDPSAFVSTSTDADLYQGWGAKYRYHIEAPGGIDVNKTLGPHIFEHEKEIAFPGGVASRFVKGANRVNPDGSLGEWIPNPGFNP
jgi:hypothetical protein